MCAAPACVSAICTSEVMYLLDHETRLFRYWVSDLQIRARALLHCGAPASTTIFPDPVVHVAQPTPRIKR